jgi:hypothetical protein
MDEACSVWLDARKVHFGTTLYAINIFVQTLGLALPVWHYSTAIVVAYLGDGFITDKLRQPIRNCRTAPRCVPGKLVLKSLICFQCRFTCRGNTISTRIGLAGTVASPCLCLLQIRVDSDTPSLAAITCVAPGVRFSDFAIFMTPALALAIAFICRTSSLVHSRRTIFFLVLAISAPVIANQCLWSMTMAIA